MKKTFLILAKLALFIFAACSSDDDPVVKTKKEELTKVKSSVIDIPNSLSKNQSAG